MTPTARLLAFAAAPHVLPGSVRADCERLVADTLAVGAAGWTAPGMAGVLAVARGWGEGAEARLLGEADARLPAGAAAYANCFAIHCLEWDAVHEGAVCHALTAVVPAVLAVADRRGGAALDDMLTAIAVGVDVASGLGIAADSALSFFRPATAGIYGAALAAARIAGLPAAAFADVLGLAHAHAAGTMQAHSEGSIALPLQLANAARGAVHAVDLVRHGLTGPHDVLQGPFGHFSLFERGDLARYTGGLGQVWRISEISTKPFPSGRASHAALGALAEFAGREVAGVQLHVPPLIRHLVGRPALPDMTAAYARLCLPFLAALMLTDGQIDPRRFTAPVFADAALQALAARVELVDDGNADPNALSPQRLIVTLADGTRIERSVPATLGSPLMPLGAVEARVKAALCRSLAPPGHDPRLFAAPMAYLTDPT
ncbi:MmgE/PrpD family protein [Novosphingobium sp.]|uniref:MmgE/PrpD family protein n=1 Tax=Novosphingobium sp. TaxID=1874826 RepID=UPI001ECE0825|nr:MmgE/PrpD family protein [Novosphingobium sp.]MBK6802058.1 MmgE/PrpD family protein [Novosphingobium sp.]MBK9009331.1 MmgE/PrpD family protein [Novosphingobium sp.]